MNEMCIKIGICAVLIAIALGLQSCMKNENSEELPEVEQVEEVEEVENYTINAEITHMDCDQKDGSLGVWKYLISVRNVEKGFYATYMIDGSTYARYVVGETVTVKVTGGSYEIY